MNQQADNNYELRTVTTSVVTNYSLSHSQGVKFLLNASTFQRFNTINVIVFRRSKMTLVVTIIL
jgi:hypothetical protein